MVIEAVFKLDGDKLFCVNLILKLAIGKKQLPKAIGNWQKTIGKAVGI
jgi:hypothetical protein